MRCPRVALVAALVTATVVGGVAAIVVRGGAPAPTTSAPPPTTTATVMRTDLTTTVLTEGTLGYGPSQPVVNRVDGTYTSLPQPGTAIGFGSVLYRVDDMPVLLMEGSTPAWRTFAPGMSDGPDIGELQADLIALGYASGLLSASDGDYGASTVAAVERWQAANGVTQSGQVVLGQVVFLPAPVLVGALSAAPGQPASQGESPYSVTTTARTVSVPLGPDLPVVSTGESVSIVLPTNATTAGKVTAVGPVAQSADSQASSSSSGSQSQTASQEATVTPDDPGTTGTGADVPVQVSLAVQSAHDVLAAPISALLALAGGGYGLEVVEASGVHQLTGVTTGVFTGSQVQISGADIEAGTKVVVAQ